MKTFRLILLFCSQLTKERSGWGNIYIFVGLFTLSLKLNKFGVFSWNTWNMWSVSVCYITRFCKVNTIHSDRDCGLLNSYATCWVLTNFMPRSPDQVCCDTHKRWFSALVFVSVCEQIFFNIMQFMQCEYVVYRNSIHYITNFELWNFELGL